MCSTTTTVTTHCGTIRKRQRHRIRALRRRGLTDEAKIKVNVDEFLVCCVFASLTVVVDVNIVVRLKFLMLHGNCHRRSCTHNCVSLCFCFYLSFYMCMSMCSALMLLRLCCAL